MARLGPQCFFTIGVGKQLMQPFRRTRRFFTRLEEILSDAEKRTLDAALLQHQTGASFSTRFLSVLSRSKALYEKAGHGSAALDSAFEKLDAAHSESFAGPYAAASRLATLPELSSEELIELAHLPPNPKFSSVPADFERFCQAMHEAAAKAPEKFDTLSVPALKTALEKIRAARVSAEES